jgi:hypothetical protein
MYAMDPNQVIIVADGPVPVSIECALKKPAPGVVLARKLPDGRKVFRQAELDTLGKNVRAVRGAPRIRSHCKTNASLIRESRVALAKAYDQKIKQNKEEKKS